VARSGRFGRLPRAAPDLTSVIVSMAQEYNSQQDANIIKAWEEGGEFEGKPVTDQILLKHMRQRRDAISKDDPLWEEWDIRLDEYGFAIEESKMTLSYAQHKVNETQMATFYTKWAKKLPVNSEAYRNLMRSAAQFIDAAKQRAGGGGGGGGGGRGGGGSGVSDADLQAVYDRNERQYDIATDALTAAAIRAGILDPTISESGEDFNDLRGGAQADHARTLNLFDQINTDPNFADIKAYLAEEGLGGLTYGSYIQLGDSKLDGLRGRLNLARAAGEKGMASDLEDDIADQVTSRARWGDIDEIAAYQTMRHDIIDPMLGAVTEDGRSYTNPFAMKSKLDDYFGYLDQLAANPNVSDETKGFVNNERMIGRDPTVLGAGRSLQEYGGEGQPSDALLVGQSYEAANFMIDEINAGRAFLALSNDSLRNEVFDIVASNDPRLPDKSSGMMVVMPTGVKGQRGQYTYVNFTPIYAEQTVADQAQGSPGSISTGQPQQIGVTYTVNGKQYWATNNGTSMDFFTRDPFNVPASQRRTDQNTGAITMTVPLAAGSDPNAPFNPNSEIITVPTGMRGIFGGFTGAALERRAAAQQAGPSVDDDREAVLERARQHAAERGRRRLAGLSPGFELVGDVAGAVGNVLGDIGGPVDQPFGPYGARAEQRGLQTDILPTQSRVGRGGLAERLRGVPVSSQRGGLPGQTGAERVVPASMTGPAVDPAAVDDNLFHSERFGQGAEAYYYSDMAGLRELLNTPDQQMAKWLQIQYQGDEEAAAAAWADWRLMRDTGVGLANREYGIIQLENAKQRMGPDPELAGRTNGRFEQLFKPTASTIEEGVTPRTERQVADWEASRKQVMLENTRSRLDMGALNAPTIRQPEMKLPTFGDLSAYMSPQFRAMQAAQQARTTTSKPPKTALPGPAAAPGPRSPVNVNLPLTPAQYAPPVARPALSAPRTAARAPIAPRLVPTAPRPIDEDERDEETRRLTSPTTAPKLKTRRGTGTSYTLR